MIRAIPILTALALPLGACAWNPFQPSPGGTKFSMTPEGAMQWESNGIDRDAAQFDVTMPNGARIKGKVNGSKAADSAINATNQQAMINMALVAAIPKLSPADIMKLMAMMAGVPPVVP